MTWLYTILFRQKALNLLGLHILLGALSVVSNIFIIVWIWMCLYLLLAHKLSLVNRIILISYIVSLEIIGRIVKCSPFVPYELSKYLLIFYPLLLSISNKRAQYYALLLVPGILIGILEETELLLIVFNVFAWFSLYSLNIMTVKREITTEELTRLILLITCALTSALINVFVLTPEFADIDFGLEANFETTGGFGPNQVSTALGVGFAFIGFSILTNLKVYNRWIEFIFFFLFLFQAVLTFSRGGVLVGLVVLLLVYFLDIFQASRNKAKKLTYFFLITAGTVFSAYTINQLSKNTLYLRYSGETFGTQLGIKQKNLNVITSGRVEIFEQDWAIFKDYWFLGAGVDVSRELRAIQHINNMEIASHVELSRLLAEHGIFGLIFFLLTIGMFYKSFRYQPLALGKKFVVLCFVIGIITTFHSATRTFATPLISALGMLRIIK